MQQINRSVPARCGKKRKRAEMANPVKLKATVTSIEDRGGGVFIVSIKPEGRVPRFKAGQFLHLTLEDFDPAGGFWPESRVFSIASKFGEDEIIIVYSVKGKYTSRMAAELSVGRSIWIKLPFGDFVVRSKSDDEGDVVLVAGGTGISPFVPFLEDAPDRPERQIRLFYGVREANLLLFSNLLSRKVASGAVDIRLWIESTSGSPEGMPFEARAVHGRLDAGRVHDECADLVRPRFFLSGPPQMIDAFKSGLAARGVGADRIFFDEWE
jgi:ferredoxin-NADP reductase